MTLGALVSKRFKFGVVLIGVFFWLAWTLNSASNEFFRGLQPLGKQREVEIEENGQKIKRVETLEEAFDEMAVRKKYFTQEWESIFGLKFPDPIKIFFYPFLPAFPFLFLAGYTGYRIWYVRAFFGKAEKEELRATEADFLIVDALISAVGIGELVWCLTLYRLTIKLSHAALFLYLIFAYVVLALCAYEVIAAYKKAKPNLEKRKSGVPAGMRVHLKVFAAIDQLFRLVAAQPWWAWAGAVLVSFSLFLPIVPTLRVTPFALLWHSHLQFLDKFFIASVFAAAALVLLWRVLGRQKRLVGLRNTCWLLFVHR